MIRFLLVAMATSGWLLHGTPVDAQLRRGALRLTPPVMQTPAVPPAPLGGGRHTGAAVETSLTNADVVKMVRAGLSDVVITGVIAQASSVRFDIGPDALIALKAARVSDELISAMMRRGGPRPADQTTRVAHASATPVSRAVALGITEAGIFLQQGGTLQMLEPTGFTQGKTGGVFTSALTYGIKKAKWKAVVNRPRASVRVTGSSATFYFAFEKLGGGLSYTGGGFASWLNGASSPNEFVLARMTAKDNGRELVLGEFGMWGASSGTRSQDTVEMRVERLEPGLYRVVAGPLEPGREYCFFHSTGAQTPGVGTTSAGTLFDFGVDAQ